jgi:DegV family protein with EDD domain
MPGIQVVTDSACDLPDEVVERSGIQVVPLTIRFGDEELVDRSEISTKEFWDRVITGPDMPQTAAPSPGAFQAVFEQAADAGSDAVICVNLSSKVSATYQAARTAADAASGRIPIAVLDSLTMTMGLGLLVLEAVDLAATGAPLDEIMKELEDASKRTHVFGVVDSLDFLRKGGRIGGASHLVGSLLSIKPVLDVRDGVVEVESKQRTRTRAVQYLANKAVDAGPLKRLSLAVGQASDDNEVIDLLKNAKTENALVLSELGPVVGSHTGPGSLGVCFMLERK